MASIEHSDALILGGGHNGLVCACYLAAAGLSVTVLERRGVAGGAAVTQEFHPGFRNSVAAYTVSLLNPKVIADLELARHGLRILERPLANFLPGEEHGYLKSGGEATLAEVARHSARDAQQLPEYWRRLDLIADVLRELALEAPPNVTSGGWRDALPELLKAKRLGQRLARLDMQMRRELLELFARSAGDYLDQWFEGDAIKAVLGFDSIVGHYASPYTPGSAYVQLHHVFGEVNGKKGAWGHAVGGMGAITQAMAACARERGVRVQLQAPVRELLVEQGRAVGARTDDGREWRAGIVASSLNPRLLFQQLVDPALLPPAFNERIARYRCGSGTFRMNVALSELPDFRALPGRAQAEHHGAGIIMAPTLAWMDEAYLDARRDGWSRKPIVEMLIPSTIDDSLAPKGQHVASLFCQHFAPVLPGGRGWDEVREQVADHVIDSVTRFAPNFKAAVLGRQVLSPLDLEREFGLIGGDIFHGALTLDQLFSARPMLGHADYRGPLAGLYLCGSGSHPGGGVTGAPGHNAARAILADRKSWRKRSRGRRRGGAR